MWTYEIPADSKRADVFILEALHSGRGVWTPASPPQDSSSTQWTRSQIQRLMKEGHFHLLPHSIILRPNDLLKKGMTVQFTPPEPKPSTLIPENIALDILFEDEHLVVINKPQGLTVHPSPTQISGTLVHALLFHIQNLSGIGGTLRPGIVHRIDKNTSGALVITKTDAAHVRLAEVFARHDIQRTYWALCYGAPPHQNWERIESLIGRHETDRKKMSMKVSQGRKAITHYRMIEAYQHHKQPFASWIEATLETGRTHQIRVHLTGAEHSLLGDPTYGTPSQKSAKLKALPVPLQTQVQSLPGQMLHARVLGFKHPITSQKLYFEAPLSSSFTQMLTALQEYRLKPT